MLGTFFGLEISTKGLRSQQAAVEVTAHNISNASTPGYSRQRADLNVTSPMEVPGSMSAMANQVGTGVQVQQITRIRDQFLDNQYRQQNQYAGEWGVRQATMDKIKSIVNEPSDTGLSNAMQTFWDAWGKLGSNPGNIPAARELQQDAQTVTDTLNQMGAQYTQLSKDLSDQRDYTVGQVNELLSQISSVTKQIQAVQQYGDQPNDLMDTRDQLVDQLSQFVDVKVDQTGGHYKISVSSSTVLQDDQAPMTFAVRPVPPPSPLPSNVVYTDQVKGGGLFGIEESLQSVTSYSSDLDAFANTLATGQTTVKLAGAWQFPMPANGKFPGSAVKSDGTTKLFDTTTAIAPPLVVPKSSSNSPTDITIDNSTNPAMVTVPAGTIMSVAGLNGLMALGYASSGQASASFFTSGTSGGTITASNITVGATADQIGYALRPAMSTTTPPTPSTVTGGLDGDGLLAITINNLKSSNFNFPSSLSQPAGTLDEFLQGEVGRLGIDSQQANLQVQTQTAMTQQIDSKRQSVSSVSIDEEMTNMIKFQQAYNASARMITTIDQMLDTLINKTGVVGQ